jgi:hypothetical protein
MNKQEVLDSMVFEGNSVTSDKVDLSYGGIAYALYPEVEWFFNEQEGNYTGDWYMVGKDQAGRYYFFTMGYGSCSGCDWLESAIYRGGPKEMGDIIDAILGTPIIENKEEALEYARKFDWQHSYDRNANNPLVKEVIEAIEKS